MKTSTYQKTNLIVCHDYLTKMRLQDVTHAILFCEAFYLNSSILERASAAVKRTGANPNTERFRQVFFIVLVEHVLCHFTDEELNGMVKAGSLSEHVASQMSIQISAVRDTISEVLLAECVSQVRSQGLPTDFIVIENVAGS